jgi:hypothetical protein
MKTKVFPWKNDPSVTEYSHTHFPSSTVCPGSTSQSGSKGSGLYEATRFDIQKRPEKPTQALRRI